MIRNEIRRRKVGPWCVWRDVVDILDDQAQKRSDGHLGYGIKVRKAHISMSLPARKMPTGVSLLT